MRILHISKTFQGGGAGLAAFGLHRGLVSAGADSRLLVDGPGDDAQGVAGGGPSRCPVWARTRSRLDGLPWRAYAHRSKEVFSPAWLPGLLIQRARSFSPDIVHLHWICGGQLRIEDLPRLSRPVVWTLHDMWALTGGCHHSHGCLKYQDHCGACPVLGSTKEQDLSHWVFVRKLKSWKDLDITLVCPSHWLSQCAQNSRLGQNLPVENIRHGIDLQVFEPSSPAQARRSLGLPADKPLLLFGAEDAVHNPYKGFDTLGEILTALAELGAPLDVELVVFGSAKPQPKLSSPVPMRFLGTIADQAKLAQLYAAADVFLAPSKEEALGLTLMEAMACGTPCAAFAVGGIPDTVEDGRDGCLAPPGDKKALARAIARLLKEPALARDFGLRAREKAEREFSHDLQVERYQKLYNQILTAKEKSGMRP